VDIICRIFSYVTLECSMFEMDWLSTDIWSLCNDEVMFSTNEFESKI